MARTVLLRSLSPVNLAGSILTNRCGLIPTKRRRSIPGKILMVAVCVLASAWIPTATLAQHAGGHVGPAVHNGSGGRMAAPSPAAIPRPRMIASPHGAGLHPAGGIRFQPNPVFRSQLFLGAPILRFRRGFRFGRVPVFYSAWWSPCTPSLAWAWGWGFNCYAAPFYGYGFENYISPPTYETSVYQYYGEDRDQIWLYLKDDTVYAVTDYWLVNGQMHFSTVEDDPTKPAEHAFPYNELDVQKTTFVNTRRGFRIVFRDEPWQQYLKDHPDVTPPDLPPQKN